MTRFPLFLNWENDFMAKKAFFLDRDGVVIRQISYLHDPELVELE